MAMQLQYLSGKLGITTGYSLPEPMRTHLKRPAYILPYLVGLRGGRGHDRSSGVPPHRRCAEPAVAASRNTAVDLRKEQEADGSIR